jgi:enamine deaminase RidA (YjgF/YER057c/UK114 family)
MNRYLTFLPDTIGDAIPEWEQCLEKMHGFRLTDYKLVKVNVFANMPDYQAYVLFVDKVKRSLTEKYGNSCPAFSVILEPPHKPLNITVEARYMNDTAGDFVTKFNNSIPYVVRESDSAKEIWAGGMGAGLFPADTRKASQAAFDQMREILETENMSYDNIVRQWNFIGNILEIKNDLQNYQVFNEVRSENYLKFRKIHSYPAATGIGVKHGGVTIDFYAVEPRRCLKIIAIDNPDQIRPYDYSQQVLRGKPLQGKDTKQPPQFERAVFVADRDSYTLFVSGTASIIGQATIGIDDVEKQTEVTLENIKKLTDASRIQHLTGNSQADAGKLILLRAYIKYQEDFPKVESICNERFPGVPIIYCEADVCRDNLLVEIEAEFSRNIK